MTSLGDELKPRRRIVYLPPLDHHERSARTGARASHPTAPNIRALGEHDAGRYRQARGNQENMNPNVAAPSLETVLGPPLGFIRALNH